MVATASVKGKGKKRTYTKSKKKRNNVYERKSYPVRLRSEYRTIKNFFPLTQKVKLEYNANFTLVSGALDYSGTQAVFRLTSIYDPAVTSLTENDTTVVGHSVWGNIYSKYLVVKTEIIATFYDPSKDGCHCIVSLNQGLTTSNKTIKNLTDYQNLTIKPMSNTGEQKLVIKRTIYPWNVLDKNKLQYMALQEDYESTWDNNPVTMPFLYINTLSNSDTANQTVQCKLKLIFHCELSSRKNFIAS